MISWNNHHVLDVKVACSHLGENQTLSCCALPALVSIHNDGPSQTADMILCKRAVVTSSPFAHRVRSNGMKSEGSNIKVPYAYLLSSNFLPVSNLHKALIRRLFIKFQKYESDVKISYYENLTIHNIYFLTK